MPAEIAVTPDDNPDTATGTAAFVVDPFPSWPSALRPQHHAAPNTSAQEKLLDPVAMAVTPDDNPDTATGTLEPVVDPFPSCPLPLVPQQRAAPDTTAHEWLPPVEIAVTPDDSPDTATGTLELVVDPFPS